VVVPLPVFLPVPLGFLPPPRLPGPLSPISVHL
jgi:hypothetical protein